LLSRFSQERKPLIPDTIKDFLRKDVRNKRIADLINKHGIDFGELEELSGFLEELRNLSAEEDCEDLIEAVRREWGSSRILVVETNPPGATVYVNGRERGITNENGLRIEGLRPREYTIKVEKEGQSREYRISLIEESKRSTVDLRPPPVEYGLLVVNSFPWSTVHVDGKDMGFTPKKIKLQVGTHQLLLKREGYRDWEKEITVKQGEETRIFVELQPIQPIKLYMEESGENSSWMETVTAKVWSSY